MLVTPARLGGAVLVDGAVGGDVAVAAVCVCVDAVVCVPVVVVCVWLDAVPVCVAAVVVCVCVETEAVFDPAVTARDAAAAGVGTRSLSLSLSPPRADAVATRCEGMGNGKSSKSPLSPNAARIIAKLLSVPVPSVRITVGFG